MGISIVITQKLLKQLFIYAPLTGLFTRRVYRRGHKVDAPVGHLHKTGRVFININGKSYAAHRLAWLYVYGKMPTADIDHINGNPSDNRIANLRDVSRSTNLQNQRKPSRNNKTGFLGVSPSGDHFTSRITINKKEHHLGRFKSAKEAHAAYIAAKRKHHEGCTV